MKLTAIFVFSCAGLVAGPPNIAQWSQTQAAHAMHMNSLMTQQSMQANQARAKRAAQQAALARENTRLAANLALAAPSGEGWGIPYNHELPFSADGDLVVAAAPRSSRILMGINRADGSERWRIKLPARLTCGPVLGKDLVLVSTSDEELLALGRQDGKQRFRVKLPDLRAFIDESYVKSYVNIGIPEGDQVLVSTYGKGEDGEPTGKALRWDLKTGEVRWEQPLETGSDFAPMDLGERLLVSGAPWLRSLGPDGTPGWKVKYEGVAFSMGTVLGGGYVFPERKKVRMVDLKDGHELWNTDKGWDVTGEGDRVLLTRGSKLFALDAATGAESWTLDGVTPGSLWADHGHAMVLKKMDLLGLAVATGKVAWSNTLPSIPIQAPLLLGDYLVVWLPGNGKTSTLMAVDSFTGKTAWKVAVRSYAGFGQILADSQGLLVGGEDDEGQRLICLR